MHFDNLEDVNNINICDLPVCDNTFDVIFVVALGGDNIDKQNYRFHSHTFYELHFILDGDIVYEADGEEFLFDKGHIVLFKPDCLHRVKSSGNKLMKLTLGFEMTDGCEFHDVPPISHYDMKPVENEFLNLILKNIRLGECSEKLLKKQFTDLLYMIFDKAVVNTPEDDKCDDRVYMAKRYIADNQSELFNCSDVAAYCHLSAKQLGRLFQKYENMSVLDYIHKSKMEYICKLVRERDLSVQEIGSMAGFSDVNYFCRFFKKYSGMTISEYKEMCGNEISCND